MPAKSEKEAHLFGMAAAYKSGEKKLSDFPESVRNKIKKLADSMSLEKLKDFTHVKEDGAAAASASSDASAAPAAGAATLTSTVGRGSYDFGNNPQNGNSDQRRGSGEPMGGGGQRELTEEEKRMFRLSKALNGEKVVEMISYKEFRGRIINEAKAHKPMNDLDKAAIQAVGIMKDYKEQLAIAKEEGNSYTPLEHFDNYVEMLADDDSRALRRLYKRLQKSQPKLAKRIKDRWDDRLHNEF